MKRCPKCKVTYDNRWERCFTCGVPLEERDDSKIKSKTSVLMGKSAEKVAAAPKETKKSAATTVIVKKTSKTNTPTEINKIIQERLDLEKKLKLGTNLYQLLDILRVNKELDETGTVPWPFYTINKVDVEIKKSTNEYPPDDVKRIHYFNKSVTIYRFEYKGRRYYAILYKSSYIAGIKIEVKREDKIIFRANVYYKSKEPKYLKKNVNVVVDAFIPTFEWYDSIIQKAFLVEKEETENVLQTGKRRQKIEKEKEKRVPEGRKKYFIE